MITFRYVPPAATIGEIEEWCAERGYTVDVSRLHVGPDGMFRGACRVPEESRRAPCTLDT